jgi:DNA replication protein DnaC
MRTLAEIERIQQELLNKFGEKDPRTEYFAKCFEAGIPKTFWECSSDWVSDSNRAVFDEVILKYCAKRKKAQRHGYSLLLHGDNGTGKTFFICFVATQMLRRGCSVYYTTLPQLDADLKRSFDDRVWNDRLRSALDADFLAVDEVGKEHIKIDGYARSHFEMVLKTRYDDGDPVLIGTNLDLATLYDVYGSSLSSVWDGKYLKVPLMPGDHRALVVSRMNRDLGVE